MYVNFSGAVLKIEMRIGTKSTCRVRALFNILYLHLKNCIQSTKIGFWFMHFNQFHLFLDLSLSFFKIFALACRLAHEFIFIPKSIFINATLIDLFYMPEQNLSAPSSCSFSLPSVLPALYFSIPITFAQSFKSKYEYIQSCMKNINQLLHICLHFAYSPYRQRYSVYNYRERKLFPIPSLH